MSTAVINLKGQIVIPARIRAELGLQAGSRLEFVKTEEGWLIKAATLPVTALKGLLKKRRRIISVVEMNFAIRRRAGR